jgi:glycosyltransferase involved in cell wall biosynthesis
VELQVDTDVARVPLGSVSVPAGPEASALAIVPAHNEEGRIGSVVAAVAAQGLRVLVVDDGSVDGTAAEASAAGAYVLRLEPNRGKGAALKAGFTRALGMVETADELARSDHAAAGRDPAAEDGSDTKADDPGVPWAALLTLDGDGQHDPEEIPTFIAAWSDTGADLVVGMRDYRDMPPVRWFTNSASRLLLSWALGQRIPDNQSGYRLHSRRIAEAAMASEEQGFAFEVEEIAICVGRGYRLAWVPIKTIYGTEKSDIKPWTHFRSFMRVTRRARARVKTERRAARTG